MNLKVPGAILPLGCAILSTRAKTVRGVGTTRRTRRTRVKLRRQVPTSTLNKHDKLKIVRNYGVSLKMVHVEMRHFDL